MTGRGTRRASNGSAGTVTALAGLRIAIGAGAWLAPGLTGGLFGMQVNGNPEAVLMARLFAVRDAALGIGTLQVTGDARRLLLVLGVGCDVLDAAAGMLALRSDRLPKRAGLLLAAVAASAAAVGVQALASGE